MTDESKIRLDLGDLTLRELDDAANVLGSSLADAMQGTGQFRAFAAVAWVVKRRDDPTYTFDDALDLRTSDFELVQPDPEGTPDAIDAPPSSGESGASIRSVS